ncbi:hypothetical protein Pint_28485 [Pistacia integerrima]|uniref:Uncharacterized protein n=1 Tax=Pistacia integerrima TaxID=434235 RepID=A0ACC0YUA2_9ROSI|nr:hypothetical protein Pint_28485 [Pistacia integerrima]
MPSPRKEVTLISSDGVHFKIDKAIAIRCGTIKQVIDEDGAGNVFTLHKINSRVLRMVILYLDHHQGLIYEDLFASSLADLCQLQKILAASAADADRDLREVQSKRSAAKEKLKIWDATFVKAADYLDIPELLALSKQAFFDRFSWGIEIPDDISVIFDNMFASGISYDSV